MRQQAFGPAWAGPWVGAAPTPADSKPLRSSRFRMRMILRVWACRTHFYRAQACGLLPRSAVNTPVLLSRASLPSVRAWRSTDDTPFDLSLRRIRLSSSEH